MKEILEKLIKILYHYLSFKRKKGNVDNDLNIKFLKKSKYNINVININTINFKIIYSVLADLIDICTPYPEIKAEDWEFPPLQKAEENLSNHCEQKHIQQFKNDLDKYSLKLPPGYANEDENWLGGVCILLIILIYIKKKKKKKKKIIGLV